MSPAEQAAQWYTRRGRWPLFLVAGDCRTPIRREGEFEHGYKDATADPAEIIRRLKLYPSANLALACGEASGVFVLDIDCKGSDGFATLDTLQAANGLLPDTWSSRTPSGGEHRLFTQPDRAIRNRVNFAPGLDVRTTGGSIALPPSRKPVGEYKWINRPGGPVGLADAPAWLLELIDPPAPPPREAQPLRMTSSDKIARYVAAAVDSECSELARMGPNSGRNMRLFQAAANLGELVGAHILSQDGAEAALEMAAHDCGLVGEDGIHAVRQSIASGMRKGIAKPREVAA